MTPVPNKPGSEWTPQERDQVRQWVCQPEQLDKLYTIARRRCPAEPPERVWNEFFGSAKPGSGTSPPKSRFDRTLDGFNPSQGDFWSYLRMRFECFCRERVTHQPTAKARLVSLDQPELGSAETAAPFRTRLADPTQTQPDEIAAERDTQSFCRQVVEPVLGRLTPAERRVVEQYYFELQSGEAIAQATGHTVTWVKVTLHRARQKVLAALIEQQSAPLPPAEQALLRLHYIAGFHIDRDFEHFTTGQIAGALQVRAGEAPPQQATAPVQQLLDHHHAELGLIQSALALGPPGPEPPAERFLKWLGAVTALLDQAKQHLGKTVLGEE